jgi:hypothetical protein
MSWHKSRKRRPAKWVGYVGLTESAVRSMLDKFWHRRHMDPDSGMTFWNTGRAMIYGAAIGCAAAAVKLFAPWSEPHTLLAVAEELVGAALAFALLCGLAAALRNFIARRLGSL